MGAPEHPARHDRPDRRRTEWTCRSAGVTTVITPATPDHGLGRSATQITWTDPKGVERTVASTWIGLRPSAYQCRSESKLTEPSVSGSPRTRRSSVS